MHERMSLHGNYENKGEAINLVENFKIEKDLMEKYNFKNIDVLKVEHHGSKTSSGKEFVNKIMSML